MRVIAGEFRSRLLKSLAGLEVRPTPDRLREALFNVLAPRIAGAIFADLYAGTGAVGIEALSRGAARAVFIEQDRAALAVLRENIKSLHLESRAFVRNGNATALLAALEADIFFLDPPYRVEPEYEKSLTVLGEKSPPLVIAQHASRFKLGETYGRLQRVRVLKQGDNSLSFYEPVK
jgi:16S rRNA (guanine966-N2)-methyltransferase